MSNLFDYFAIPTERPQRRRAASAAVRAEEGIRFEGVGFRIRRASADGQVGAARRRRLRPQGAEPGAGRARTAPARRRSSSCSPASTSRPRGACCSTGATCAPGTSASCARASASSSRTSTSTSSRCARTSAFGSVDHLDDELRVGRAVEQGGAKELVATLAGGPRHAARALVHGRRRAVGRAVAEGGARARVHARGGRHPDPRRADGGAGRRGRARRVPALPRARRRAHRRS